MTRAPLWLMLSAMAASESLESTATVTGVPAPIWNVMEPDCESGSVLDD